MKKQVVIFFIMLSMMIFGTKGHAEKPNEVQKIVNDVLFKKIKTSGTLDIYDDKIEGVRNLRRVSFGGDFIVEGEKTLVSIIFRDTKRGDIVTVVAEVIQEQGSWSVGQFIIGEVQKNVQEAPKEYSDEDYRKAMLAFIEQQAKFTGYISMYDESKGNLRQCQLEKLEEELRKFGQLTIATAYFKDIKSQETVKADITVIEVHGLLKVDALRIREVK